MNIEEINQEQAQYLLETSKVKEQINDMALATNSGWVNPLEAYVKLKELEELVSTCLNVVKDLAIDEAEKYENKEFKFFGHKVAIRNSAGRWDYSNVDQINEMKGKVKSLEKLAQSAAAEAKFGNKVFDSDGVEISPAIYNEGKTNIVVTLAKD